MLSSKVSAILFDLN